MGTARRTDPQTSESKPGIVNDIAAGRKRVWGRTAEGWRNRDHQRAAGEEKASGDMIEESDRRTANGGCPNSNLDMAVHEAFPPNLAGRARSHAKPDVD